MAQQTTVTPYHNQRAARKPSGLAGETRDDKPAQGIPST
jgi:hypothetical protein